MTESFQIQVIDEMEMPRTKVVHLFYSRSNQSLIRRQVRYFNRSDIIHHHPFSVRIEAYKLKPSFSIYSNQIPVRVILVIHMKNVIQFSMATRIIPASVHRISKVTIVRSWTRCVKKVFVRPMLSASQCIEVY